MGVIRTAVAIKKAGDGYTDITTKGAARRVKIYEVEEGSDGTFTPLGLNVKWPDDGFVAAIGYVASQQPIVIEDAVPQGNAGGRLLSLPDIPIPGGETRAADVLCKIEGATAATTTVIVEEYA